MYIKISCISNSIDRTNREIPTCMRNLVDRKLTRRQENSISNASLTKTERWKNVRVCAYLSQFSPVTVQRATGCKRVRRKPWRTHQVPAIGQEPVVKISNIRHTAASTAPKCISNKVLAVCCCCVCGHRSRLTR